MVGLEEDIVTQVKRSRLRWYGHVLRRGDMEGIKRVMAFEVEGVRGRGRPRLQWKEQMENDRVKAGLEGVQANNRPAWREGVFRLLS